MPDRRRTFLSSLLSILTIVIIIALAAEVIYLARQNRQLRAALAEDSEKYETLQPGDQAPVLQGVDSAGQAETVNYPHEKPTIIFWFAAECSACRDNIIFWNQLFVADSAGRFRYVGATYSDSKELAAFRKEERIPFPVINVTDPQLMKLHRATVIPQTVMIDSAGQIRKVWPGVLTETDKNEIMGMMQLPIITGEGGE